MNRMRFNKSQPNANRPTICGRILLFNIILFIILLLLLSHISLPPFLEDLLINQRIKSIPSSDQQDSSFTYNNAQIKIGYHYY